MDMLTLLFKSRTLTFDDSQIGKKVPLEFAIDKEIYNIYFINIIIFYKTVRSRVWELSGP